MACLHCHGISPQSPQVPPFLLPITGKVLHFQPALTTHCDLLAVTGRDPVDVWQLYQMFPGFMQKIQDIASMELLLGGRGGKEQNNTDIREGR